MSGQKYPSNFIRKQEETKEWRSFHSRFMQLAREEQGREVFVTNGQVLRSMNKLLRASCSYGKHPEIWYEKGKPDHGSFCLLETPPHGIWNYCSDGLSENFRERVRVCVAEGGRALPDYPIDTDPEDFWLHRLYLDMIEKDSDLLFAASEEDGMILSVCVASATFCSRLERRALETDSAERRKPIVSEQRVGGNSMRRDPEVAKRTTLVKANAGVPAAMMCEIFDRDKVPLPAKWVAAGFKAWSAAYKNPRYRSRINTLISKDRVR